jgi:hypothetical protein
MLAIQNFDPSYVVQREEEERKAEYEAGVGWRDEGRDVSAIVTKYKYMSALKICLQS